MPFDRERWATQIHGHKESYLKNYGERVAMPMVIPEWGGLPIAEITVAGSRDDLFSVLKLCRVNMLPDHVTLALDSLFLECEPGDAAKRWERRLKTGDVTLQELAEAGGIEAGLVAEVMVAIRCGRDGKSEVTMMRYRAQPDRTIEWGSEEVGQAGRDCYGDIPDRVAYIMTTSEFDFLFRIVEESRLRNNLDPERARFLQTRTGLRFLHEAGLTVIPLYEGFDELLLEFYPEVTGELRDEMVANFRSGNAKRREYQKGASNG